MIALFFWEQLVNQRSVLGSILFRPFGEGQVLQVQWLGRLPACPVLPGLCKDAAPRSGFLSAASLHATAHASPHENESQPRESNPQLRAYNTRALPIELDWLEMLASALLRKTRANRRVLRFEELAQRHCALGVAGQLGHELCR